MNDSYKLLNKLASSAVKSGQSGGIFVVDNAKSPELYSDIKADKYSIPKDIILVLVNLGSREAVLGDGEHTWSDSTQLGGGGSEPIEVSWEDIEDKPTTFAPTIGVTADTAKAGNYQPTWSQVTGKPTTFTPTIGNTATTALAGDTVIPSPSTTTPLANGTATAGTSTSYARQDHVHPLQTTVSGNAGTATALATGRTIGLTGGATGTSAVFNGTANATIAVTLATPTATVRGGVLAQAGIPDLPTNAELGDVVDILNELLFALRASGTILP